MCTKGNSASALRARASDTYADGREYVGEFRQGKLHGLGKMTYSDGSLVRGWICQQ